MISIDHTDQWTVFMNAGRPDLFCDEDRAFWKTFHRLIETSLVEIKVNGMYSYISDVLAAGGGYGGGGMQYLFWFKNQDDKEAFLIELKTSLPEINIPNL